MSETASGLTPRKDRANRVTNVTESNPNGESDDAGAPVVTTEVVMPKSNELRRDILALSCAVSAGIHVGLVHDHLREQFAAGAGFAVSALALAVLAVAVARRPDEILVDAAAVLLAGLIAAWVLAVTTGIPGLVPEPEAVDALALVTKAVEVVGLAVALSLRGTLVTRLRTIPVALVALVIALSAVAAVATSRGHGHGGHAHDEHLQPHDSGG